jgi:D-cysteine desulfhydrase family pyridoxal phosphate-dependent enzyme
MSLSFARAEVETAAPLSQYSRAREDAINTFGRMDRLRLANLFTPIERADRLRELIPGAPQLYVKRDDLTGYLAGGNKLRKLEYVMADVLAKGATTVLTTGAVKSNHVRTTALIARRLGLKCALVLNGDDPNTAKANSRVADLLGVAIHTVATREERAPKMEEVAEKLEKVGERVYKIPLGGSDEIGSFGFVAAMEELIVQELDLNADFDAVVLASSSCGTQAGLEVGKRLFEKDSLEIIGISPGSSSKATKECVLALMNCMLHQLGLPSAKLTDLSVDDRFVGPGYGISTRESEEAAKLFANAEGILLDPVYTSKAAAGLIQYCRDQRFKEADRVLFWHTGGLMSLF